MTPVVATGLDRIASGDAAVVARLRGRKVGLVAHPASVDRRLMHASFVLAHAGADIRAFFGPEHGYGGEAQDMASVGGARGADGVPIYSLYGATEAELAPTAEQLEGLDAIVIDLQDVGARYYTFVWTAVLVMRAAAARGIETIVLDRPNPLGGELVEGAPQRAGHRSFVGLCDVPVRHGLTIGELVAHVRAAEKLDDRALTVVAMRGWRRAMTFPQTGLPWVLPSPNMPTYDTARVYPGGCLVEGTNLSEGRGTTRPFEIFGAPYLDGRALARRVSLRGAVLRPLTFTPTFHKHAGTRCGGVQVHVTNERAFSSYAAYLVLLDAIRRQAGERFAWRSEVYEFVKDRLAIDLLTGGPEAREAIDRGSGLDEVLAREEAGAAVWREQRRPMLAYA
jgi:uncharacterized protein YbbC (DUF1343 family)